MAKRLDTLDAPDDAIATLKADHRRVRELFQTYEHTRDPHLKQQIAAQVYVALELYTLLEETGFSPTFTEATAQKGEALGEEAHEEHHRVRELIAALRTCDAADVACEPRFRELMDAVLPHV
jgi:recombinational DNA repair protein (RecF pathway)